MTDYIDMSVINDDLEKLYLSSKSEVIKTNNQNDNIDEKVLFKTVSEKVRDRIQCGIYISFKDYDHIYYYDCSNTDIPNVEYPGKLVLPGLDGYCRYQFEDSNTVSIVLSAGENKYECSIESPGLYRVEGNIVTKIEDCNVEDELIQFQLEACRIHLSPLLFNNEDYHTNEEILKKLMDNRRLNKVYLTNFVKKDKEMVDNNENIDVIVNIHDNGNNSESTNVTKSTTTIVRTTEVNVTRTTTTISEGSSTIELKDKCNCYDYCNEDCTCVSNCSNNCDICKNETENRHIIDEEEKIIIYTNYKNVHIWNSDFSSNWPGKETVAVEGENFREIVIDGKNCCLIGNNFGSDSSAEFSIDRPGKYYLTKEGISSEKKSL